MVTSTLTDKGQTPVPQEIREALGVAPRQRLLWEVRQDGSAVVRPMPSVMELAGALNSKKQFKSVSEETEAAQAAWVAGSIKRPAR